MAVYDVFFIVTTGWTKLHAAQARVYTYLRARERRAIPLGYNFVCRLEENTSEEVH